MHAISRERLFLYGELLGMLLIATMLAMPARAAFAADLVLSPATGSFPVGTPFTVTISVDPGGQSVNAADGTIAFDPAVLSVDSISQQGSAFSLWTANPTFSNSAGTITFSGGTPTGFSALSSILTVSFTPNAVAASTTISFSKGSILAADGKGTDVYKNGDPATYAIVAAAPAAPAAPADATDASGATDATNATDLSGDPTPIAPQITSDTDPKSDSWYASSTADFAWVNTPDITGARYIIASSSDATPTTVLKGAASTTTVSGIPDGVWYFVAQLKNGSGWGPSGNMEVQIDTTPPAPFTIALVAAAAGGGVAQLSFSTTDTLSGIDHYELLLGSTTDQTLSTTDVVNNMYPVPPQGGGPTSVTINAYDKAGNVRSETQELTLPKVDPPASADAGTAAAPASAWSLESVILIGILTLIVGMLIGWNRYTRKGIAAERSKLLKRVAEVRDTNDRVFSAMREEFEQMVNDFDEKPQLTPEEREFLEHIKEVLEVSEEIIDSGIEELKTMVRG